jgi:hypothetical protein
MTSHKKKKKPIVTSNRVKILEAIDRSGGTLTQEGGDPGSIVKQILNLVPSLVAGYAATTINRAIRQMEDVGWVVVDRAAINSGGMGITSIMIVEIPPEARGAIAAERDRRGIVWPPPPKVQPQQPQQPSKENHMTASQPKARATQPRVLIFEVLERAGGTITSRKGIHGAFVKAASGLRTGRVAAGRSSLNHVLRGMANEGWVRLEEMQASSGGYGGGGGNTIIGVTLVRMPPEFHTPVAKERERRNIVWPPKPVESFEAIPSEQLRPPTQPALPAVSEANHIPRDHATPESVLRHSNDVLQDEVDQLRVELKREREMNDTLRNALHAVTDRR